MLEHDALTVSQRQQAWIRRWDRSPDDGPRDFADVFADFYEWSDADVLLQDEFDPEYRLFRGADDYGIAFWPAFLRLRMAEHAVAEPPRVIGDGRIAAARFVFIARLTTSDGVISANRCTTSQVWRRGNDSQWRIVRDQTAVTAMPLADADCIFAAERSKSAELVDGAEPAEHRGELSSGRSVSGSQRLA